MTSARETNERRLRRLTEMNKNRAVVRASAVLQDAWTAGRKPVRTVLRVGLLQLPDDTAERASLVRLVLPRGVALRFYLLAIFEAGCRLAVGEPWVNIRPLVGVGSWSDFIAIDGAYDSKSDTYMPETEQGRGTRELRLRQTKSALETLEDLGSERALVQVPRAKNGGRRLYGQFSLMKETGRGAHQTPDTYTAPANQLSAATFTVPAEFFLKGWIQVLNPSEIATWLILQALSQWASNTHAESGVYLYGKARLGDFGLRRDAWEDGCQRLREFGLIRHARPSPLDKAAPEGLDLTTFWAQTAREQYEPHRWQVTDRGLDQDAVKICMRELTLRKKDFDTAAERRAQAKSKPSPT